MGCITRRDAPCQRGRDGGGSGLSHDLDAPNARRKVPAQTISGNRRGMPDDEAVANCVEGLNRMKKMAEDHGHLPRAPEH
jgi:hypothetical protein